MRLITQKWTLRYFFWKKAEEGFAFVEMIVVLMVLGVISSVAIPQIMSAVNKAKQKEATFIVASMIKASQSYHTEYGELPADMGGISEYAKFQKCIANNIEIEGASVCKETTPVAVETNDVLFYSSSGNYKVEMMSSQKNR